ncbi:MAG: cytochrome c oxidase subunit I [Bacteriovoracia bacterium]
MAAAAHAPAGSELDYLQDGKGIMSWLTTVDHKRIGVMYLFTNVGFFIIGGLLALLIRIEHLTPGKTIMDADMYNRVMTLHGAIMVFLFIVPGIPSALGNFLLPLMIGAKDVAFPKLNLFSYQLFVVGALICVGAIIFGGGVDTGWTFYTPYSLRSQSNVITMVTGVFLMGFSSILTGLNFIVTIHKLRAPGMTFHRMPLFVWATYATSIIQVTATPVIGITLLLLIMERVLQIGIFDPKLGGDPVLFQHFFWFYSHPVVYIMILPAFGIISEIVATFSRKPLFGYRAIAYSSLAIAVISYIVWGHHMFVSGQSDLANIIFSFLTVLVAVPTAIKIFNWTATMYKGSVKLDTPMLYALSFIVLFVIAGFTGVVLAAVAADVHLHDTYFVVAHFHYTMMGGAVIALLGGIHYWWPKMFGVMYNEKMARVGWFFVFMGFNATFLPQFVMGQNGMPRRYYNYPAEYQLWHQLSTFGSWILAFGLLIQFSTLIVSLIKKKKAEANPWGALTLEWQTESPPITHNFHETPVVTTWPYEYKSETV